MSPELKAALQPLEQYTRALFSAVAEGIPNAKKALGPRDKPLPPNCPPMGRLAHVELGRVRRYLDEVMRHTATPLLD